MPGSGNDETGVKPVSWKYRDYIAGVPIKKRRFPMMRPPSPPPEEEEEPSLPPAKTESVQKEQSSQPEASAISHASIATSSQISEVSKVPESDDMRGSSDAPSVNMVPSVKVHFSPSEELQRKGKFEMIDNNVPEMTLGRNVLNLRPTESPVSNLTKVVAKREEVMPATGESIGLSLSLKEHHSPALTSQKSDACLRHLSSEPVSLSLSLTEEKISSQSKTNAGDLKVDGAQMQSSRANWDLNTPIDAWEDSFNETTVYVDQINAKGGAHGLNCGDRRIVKAEPFDGNVKQEPNSMVPLNIRTVKLGVVERPIVGAAKSSNENTQKSKYIKSEPGIELNQDVSNSTQTSRLKLMNVEPLDSCGSGGTSDDGKLNISTGTADVSYGADYESDTNHIKKSVLQAKQEAKDDCEDSEISNSLLGAAVQDEFMCEARPVENANFKNEQSVCAGSVDIVHHTSNHVEAKDIKIENLAGTSKVSCDVDTNSKSDTGRDTEVCLQERVTSSVGLKGSISTMTTEPLNDEYEMKDSHLCQDMELSSEQVMIGSQETAVATALVTELNGNATEPVRRSESTFSKTSGSADNVTKDRGQRSRIIILPRSLNGSPGTWSSPRGRSSDGFGDPGEHGPRYRMQRFKSPDETSFTGEMVVRRDLPNDLRDMDSGRGRGNQRWGIQRSPSHVLHRNRRFAVHSGRVHELGGDGNGDERRRFGERRGPVRTFWPPYNNSAAEEAFQDNTEDGPRPFRFYKDGETEFQERGNLRERDTDRRITNRPPGNAPKRMRSIEDQEGNFRSDGQPWNSGGFDDISQAKKWF